MTAAEKDEPAIAVVADDAAILIAAASDDDEEEEEEEAIAAVALAIDFEKNDLNIKNRWRNRDLKLRQTEKTQVNPKKE
jgi:hypothetical protein